MVQTKQNLLTLKVFNDMEKIMSTKTYLFTYLQLFIVEMYLGIQYTYNHRDLIIVNMY